ncbi:MAG TPA: prolipoprotein diacylglyceryl transferase [Paracoccus sp. (in: a-proteobacteria)]|uniref:prolipoprotein diacylglyceryl transferase n=1 Tax=uncultured Paracoccus sp. TaxID=189685 RepID=UPI00262220E4|nr:prolipoprotein diacylglyceryl transferase [uncultured Paracoccus sp.]HMQ41407.1 prolipoprotein diacylglyceryl transferase [Paracoccus sp. (in: a-proteobacteria)]HMR37113.1 prolipoprotein diacylglyceryl transferase [Paracoccus sp. (in: a-proteobacteria)]
MIPFPDISPEIFTIHLGERAFSLRWYALAYLVGLVLGALAVWKLMKSVRVWGDKAPMPAGKVEDLLTWIVAGVVIGGRLGFVFFYQPGFYLKNPLEILKVWEGGMSFHGGFAGVVLAAWWWARRNEVSPLRLADALAVVAPIGLFFGRIANFINAELWGRPTDLPWGVIFPGEMAQNCPGVEGLCARHPSQLYEAGLEGLLLGLILFGLVRAGGLRRPGLALGVFLSGYALARIFVELFRVADAQFITPENPLGRVALGLSMGQILSLPMLALGLLFIIRALRLPAR